MVFQYFGKDRPWMKLPVATNQKRCCHCFFGDELSWTKTGGRSWRGGVGEAEEAVAEIDVGCSGGGAVGGGEGVEAAEAGLGEACFADDGHVLGGAVLADADAAGDEVDGEGLAFAQFAEDGPAAGIAEDAAESGEGNGGGGGIFHGVVMMEAEVAFCVEVKRIGVAEVASGRQENVGVEAEVS
jgi:hypothetical protein